MVCMQINATTIEDDQISAAWLADFQTSNGIPSTSICSDLNAVKTTDDAESPLTVDEIPNIQTQFEWRYGDPTLDSKVIQV